MNAAADFSLCGRTPRSCSRHADCARAQLGSANPQRQSFAWPADTGERCLIFHDFSPYRKLASMGGGIADTLAASESAESWETRAEGCSQAARDGARNRAQFAGPTTGKRIAGSGEPGVICDTARHMPTPAGDTSSVGLDTAEALGVNKGTACGGPTSPQDCPERLQQLRAARLLRL